MHETIITYNRYVLDPWHITHMGGVQGLTGCVLRAETSSLEHMCSICRKQQITHAPHTLLMLHCHVGG